MAFDYRQFLAENKLTKVSRGRETGKAQILSEGLRISEGFDTGEEMDEANKQKEDYLKRQERAAKGNWKGSIGAFVEEHGEELGNMISKNRQQLKDYVENVMKPELTDEAKQKVDELLDSKKSTFGFIQSLYNFTLKGSGMGLHEEAGEHSTDIIHGGEGWDDAAEQAMEMLNGIDSVDTDMYQDVILNTDRSIEDLNKDLEGTTCCVVKGYDDRPVFFDLGQDGLDLDWIDIASMSEEGIKDLARSIRNTPGVTTDDIIMDGPNLSKVLYEAYEQKYKGTPQEKGSRTKVAGKGYEGKKHGDGQDKMAKSEMTGEKMDVTINGITKSISKQAWTRYRKMTDPEEKKAWREKHGFDKK